MTFDGLMLPEMLSQSNASMWDPCKLAALSQGFSAMAPQAMQSDCYSQGGYSGQPLSQGLSQGYGTGLQMPEYTEMPYNMDSMDAMQDPSFPTYGSVPQQALPNHDASLLQVLQSQMAAANLLASHNHAGQMPMQSMANNALPGMDMLMQGQYYDLLNQASLQAVQSVLQQRLVTSQQLSVLQQLLNTNEVATPKQSKRSNRNGGSSKQRHQSRNSRKGSVAQQAPSWADGNWNPLSNVQAKGKGAREQHGTGVFLPQGFAAYTASESSNSDQMSEASSDQSSGSAFR